MATVANAVQVRQFSEEKSTGTVAVPVVLNADALTAAS